MNNYIVRPGIVLINIYGTVFLAADREARKKCAFIRELNEVGAFIWTRLEKGDDYDSIVSEVKKEYEVPEENPNLNNIGEDIVNKHMVIIKEAANILSQEGDLITNIKGVGKEQNFTLDNYIDGLELIVDKKLDMYGDIKNRIKKYRKAKKENGNN